VTGFGKHAALVVFLMASAGPGTAEAGGSEEPDPFALPQAALGAICAGTDGDLSPDWPAVAARFPGARWADPAERPLRAGFRRIERRLTVDGATRLTFRAVLRDTALARLTIELDSRVAGALRPRSMVLAGPDCAAVQGRAIGYSDDGLARRVTVFDATLARALGAEPLNPAPPEGSDPGGVSVAVIDSGIAYTRPDIAARLARDESGMIVGYDYWDMDARPFDADTSVSPFFPRRHGTLVADILLGEGPPLRLAAYRYPRPDMDRFTALIGNAAGAGVAVATLAMGSNKAEDWRAFRAAAEAHGSILFIVSAGNNGRDIDETPVYPAAFDLANLLVVTSSTAAGSLGDGANWEARAVDIAVPAEALTARGPAGRSRPVAGSSFAVPRVAALAARFKAAHPRWTASDIKKAILGLAGPMPASETRPVRFGWIADPAGVSVE